MQKSDIAKAIGLLEESPMLVDRDWEGDSKTDLTKIRYSWRNYIESWTEFKSQLNDVGISIFYRVMTYDDWGYRMVVAVTGSDRTETIVPKCVGVLYLQSYPYTRGDISKISATENFIQVTGVFVDQSMRTKGIAKQMYLGLIDHKHVIVSDNTQFAKAKLLWKQMAREGYDDGTIVKVFDAKSGREVGEKVYDGSNIPDDKIWGGEEKKETLLLVFRPKDK